MGERSPFTLTSVFAHPHLRDPLLRPGRPRLVQRPGVDRAAARRGAEDERAALDRLDREVEVRKGGGATVDR